MKNLLYIFLATSLLAGCKKETLENGPKTISGKIVQDCSMAPIANANIKLLVSESQAFTGSEVSIYDFTSDANGNFSFTVTNPPATFTSELRFGGTTIKGVLPKSTDNRNLGELIASPTANFVVKLKVNNPYGVGDTLLIFDYALNEHIKIVAPFGDRIFQPKYNYSSIQNRTLTNKNSTEVQLNHSIYNGTPGTSSFNELSSKFENFIIQGCSGAIDTIVKVIN